MPIVNASLGFCDFRNRAELMLSPAAPVSRSLTNLSSIRINLTANTGIPGVIRSAMDISGAVRNTFAQLFEIQDLAKDLNTSLKNVLRQFDVGRPSVAAGSFFAAAQTLVDDTTSTGEFPSAADFFAFSGLPPGVPIPSSLMNLIDARRRALQDLAIRLSLLASGLQNSFGVVVNNNITNKTTFPLESQIDKPSNPPLSQGGSAGKADSIYRDKSQFVVSGVPIAKGRPSFWSRLVTLAAAKMAPTMNPLVNQIFKDRKLQSSWSEPPPPYAAQHPYNKVQQTDSGHVFELDDTPAAERIHLFHRAGSFIEFHPDGTVVYKNMKDGYLLTMGNQHVKVSGKCHVAVDGGATLFVKGDVDVQSEGHISFQAKKDFNVYANNINLRAKIQSKLDGQLIDLRYATLPGIPVPTVSGLAVGWNVNAFKLDFPKSNIDQIIAIAATNPADPRQIPKLVVTKDAAVMPVDNPLANPAVYSKEGQAAANYRAKLFDSPEEIADTELHTAHIGLQRTLKDFTTAEDPRYLGGSLRTISTGLSAPVTPPSIDYLDYTKYKGSFVYADTAALGTTTFTIKDLVDASLYPTIAAPLVISSSTTSST